MPSGINTRNLTHGSLSLSDSQTAPNTFAIALDEGNLTFTEEKTAVLVKKRGVLDHWSQGEEMPVTGSFTIKFDQYTSRTTRAVAALAAGGAVTGYSLRDFARDKGGDLTSANGRVDVFTANMTFAVSDPVATGDESESLAFTDVHFDSFVFTEGAEYNTIQASFRALLVTPAPTRS